MNFKRIKNIKGENKMKPKKEYTEMAYRICPRCKKKMLKELGKEYPKTVKCPNGCITTKELAVFYA